MRPNVNHSNVTTCYQYSSQEQEHIFAYKSRPFAVLSSQFFPTPTSTYIDHRLVMELNVKMTDVGCKKMYFAGKKLRMLGKVSFTAQCVTDGNIYGNFRVKASVVEDLKDHFDTHAIAGQAMVALLRGEHDDVSSCSSTSPTRRGTLPDVSNTRPGVSKSSSITKSPPSPPGFSTKPQHPPPPVPVQPTDGDPPQSFMNGPILFSNLTMLNTMFGGADLRTDVREERELLTNLDDEGHEDVDQPLFTYIMSDESQYQTGHGRNKCRYDTCAEDNWEVPDNCGFAADWNFPTEFKPCSNKCRGGFCRCINNY